MIIKNIDFQVYLSTGNFFDLSIFAEDRPDIKFVKKTIVPKPRFPVISKIKLFKKLKFHNFKFIDFGWT